MIAQLYSPARIYRNNSCAVSGSWTWQRNLQLEEMPFAPLHHHKTPDTARDAQADQFPLGFSSRPRNASWQIRIPGPVQLPPSWVYLYCLPIIEWLKRCGGEDRVPLRQRSRSPTSKQEPLPRRVRRLSLQQQAGTPCNNTSNHLPHYGQEEVCIQRWSSLSVLFSSPYPALLIADQCLSGVWS